MTTNGPNKDQPKQMQKNEDELDTYIREFDHIMKETRDFLRDYEERKRRRK